MAVLAMGAPLALSHPEVHGEGDEVPWRRQHRLQSRALEGQIALVGVFL